MPVWQDLKDEINYPSQVYPCLVTIHSQKGYLYDANSRFRDDASTDG